MGTATPSADDFQPLPRKVTPDLHHRRRDATVRPRFLPETDTAIFMTVILH
jgi:hypothetical protein